jgi:hypothetical protein
LRLTTCQDESVPSAVLVSPSLTHQGLGGCRLPKELRLRLVN